MIEGIAKYENDRMRGRINDEDGNNGIVEEVIEEEIVESNYDEDDEPKKGFSLTNIITSFSRFFKQACARALGGVEIGRLMPRELANATETRRAVTPPRPTRLSWQAMPTAQRIGTKSVAVEVWLMKFAMNKQMIPQPTMRASGDQLANGIVLIR